MDRVIQDRAAQDAEATRVRGAVEGLLTAGRDVVVYTTRALRQARGMVVLGCVVVGVDGGVGFAADGRRPYLPPSYYSYYSQ